MPMCVELFFNFYVSALSTSLMSKCVIRFNVSSLFSSKAVHFVHTMCLFFFNPAKTTVCFSPKED